MPSLLDTDLLRIAGLGPEQATKALPALRHVTALIPVGSVDDEQSEQWPLFATAVVLALGPAATMDHEGWLPMWRAIAVVAQFVGVFRPNAACKSQVRSAILRAWHWHWINGEGYDRDGVPNRIQASPAGELRVRERLIRAGVNFVPADAAAESGPTTTAVARLKAFRKLLLRFLANARVTYGGGRSQQIDPALFEVMQDAWIELADVVYPKALYEVEAIEAAAAEMWPDHAHEVWSLAERQLGMLIVSVGSDARLQQARAEAFRADAEKIAGPLRRPGTVDVPVSSEKPFSQALSAEPLSDMPLSLPAPIEYITRDRAAALCQKSKDSLERWFKDDPNAPEPVIEGGGGRAHRYDYAKLRPWLERMSGGMRLPERLPEF